MDKKKEQINLHAKKFNLFDVISKAISWGILGFAMFFIVILFTKFLSSAINSGVKFIIDLDDVYLSLLGFFLTALIKILECFRDNTKI